MSNIRVTYSGLISLVIGIVSIPIGIVFTLIMTRQLSAEEYGIWALIGTTLMYFVISERLISFWTIRQISRGVEVGRTSIVSSMILTCAVVPAYASAMILLSVSNSPYAESMIFSVLLLPVYYINQTLLGINLAHKPQTTGYGRLIIESVKIPAALALVYFLDLGIDGAIAATMIAYLISIAAQYRYAQRKLAGRFQWSVLRCWFKLSWISLYSKSSRFVLHLDVIIYTIITGSVVGIAHYSVSLTIASILLYSSFVTNALQPKLLARGGYEYVQKNFVLVLYFAIPLLGVSVVFARDGLFALNPIYESSYLIAIVLSFRMFLHVISIIFRKVLESIDTVDVANHPRFSDMIKSKLFLVPTARYVNGIAYMCILSAVLVLFGGTAEGQDTVMWWAVISLLMEIPFFVFVARKIRTHTHLSIPYRTVSKYMMATVVFCMFFVFTSEHVINREAGLVGHLATLVLELFLCLVIYAAITFVTDCDTRKLYIRVVRELRSVYVR